MYVKNDHAFFEAVLTIMENFFSYKPLITIQQFFSPSYLEEKIQFTIDLITAVKHKHSSLSRRSSSVKENLV